MHVQKGFEFSRHGVFHEPIRKTWAHGLPTEPMRNRMVLEPFAPNTKPFYLEPYQPENKAMLVALPIKDVRNGLRETRREMQCPVE